MPLGNERMEGRYCVLSIRYPLRLRHLVGRVLLHLCFPVPLLVVFGLLS